MIVELNMTVFCACIMVLRPFCRRHLPFLLRGRNSGPADVKTPDADAILQFDGPSGPRSKSNYATKVSASSRAPKKPGKRNLWPGLGSTLVKEDDDDMESLSQELSVIAPHVHSVKGARGNHGAAGTRRWQDQDNAQSWEIDWRPRSPNTRPVSGIGRRRPRARHCEDCIARCAMT
ncbi:MAG: hypothetical protein Q9188_004893 [Gyalolechia gomerana]